ncbi:hypothetical protein AB7C87_00175 [Natrarchaeobius sp. A-rgal3]|uniref:hypothetical protein n=1 Tax=Natrarchaeobius versutus TaxID=1679078 RepID=UPI00350F4F1B
MSALSGTLRPTMPDDRVFAAAAVVALLEGIVRLVLPVISAPLIDGSWPWPPLLAILWPPVIAVFGLAFVAPIARETRTEIVDEQGEGVALVQRRLPAFASLAVVGHAVAVVGGIALFLLVDTPVRYALYATGTSDPLPLALVVYAPIFAIALGTIVAWALPAAVFVRVVRGDGIVEGTRTVIATAVTAPRAFAPLVARQVGLVAVLGVLAVGLLWWLDATARSDLEFGSIDGTVLPLAVVGLAIVFVTAAFLSASLAAAVDRFGSGHARSSAESAWSGPPAVPIVRLALVLLVLTALVAAAGAVRMDEVRPVDAEPEPLPDDPDELYATAYDNTDRSDHEYTHGFMDPEDGTMEQAHRVRIDRTDRQVVSYVGESDEPSGYYTNGRFYENTVFPGYPDEDGMVAPGYTALMQDGTPKAGEPSPDAENWTVIEERDDEIVLELTDPEDVFFAMTGSDLEQFGDEAEVHDSWGRMTVDTDRNTLVGGEFRFNVTSTDDSAANSEYDVHGVVEYEVDIDVERPDEVGSPTTGELYWRLVAY